jgi:two-component system sensor histidine kinase/response regulator
MVFGFVSKGKEMPQNFSLPFDLDFYKNCADSQVIVLVTDAEGTILYVNPSFTETFGYSEEEVRGKNPKILKSGVHSQAWYSELWAQLKRGENRRHEICDRTRDGRRVWMNVSIIPHFGSNGVPDYFVSVSYDITEYKRLQLEAEADRERALAAVRAKSDFFARMTHEIRTPMNAVLGMADLLVGSPMAPEQAEYVSILSSSGRLLLALINDVLDYSKIEAGGLSLENKPISVKELAGDVVALFARSAQEKGLVLRSEIDGLLPGSVLADPLRTTQVLSNLISNAIKFTEKGEIVLGVQKKGEREGKVSVEFAVRDTGRGMTTEQREHLFVPYSQADASVARTHGGTGLGLIISQKFVELMGGDLVVESVHGLGSRFFFKVDFEIAQAHAHAVAPKASRIEQSLGAFPPELCAKRIAVAEDNPANLKLIAAALRRMGFSPSLVENGAKLLELMDTNSFDLIFLDEQMPVMTGGEAARAIIERMGASHPPMVLITANAIAEMGDAFDPNLYDCVLTKPIDFASLRQTLMKTLTNETHAVEANAQVKSSMEEGIVTRISELRREFEDDEFVIQFLETFLQSASNTVNQILAIKRDDEALKKKRPSHALAGSSRNVGAQELAAYASRLEAASAGSEAEWMATFDPATLEKLWSDTYKALDTLIVELKGESKKE